MLKSFLNHKITKFIFSIALIGSALPEIYEDFTFGNKDGEFTHYGMFIFGIFNLLKFIDLINITISKGYDKVRNSEEFWD
tara:strand:+ start:88 stop:327 length:240 start_codon:yes stop_codon:yes gene_type:complete